ncbi:N-acetylmuramoyl-L-alanine amidase family protein [Microscilla marina]|uniref:N-acetylmuramoyl-L-alanine amidase n=1 Tax=Microscilla marina ATCC 23134 TaxID=313606 RepID=A1ZPY5_MICM2|nr:N-acetylmuramoyl-L-alanine amidase [Microscilla marina]EAY27640.1 N-acetylmuramoyl-L-alanine amidase [Microscilla marina ATCC 23134]
MLKRLLLISCLFIVCISTSFLPVHVSQAPDKSEVLLGYKVKTVVIDAGHGGKDPGTLGKHTKEKNITLRVALELGRIIKRNLPGVKVVYTRTTDKFVELYRRTELANRIKADLFISIHCNAAARKARNRSRAKGAEVYVMGNHVSEDNLAIAKRENSSILLEKNYQRNYGGFDPNSPQSYILLAMSQQVHMKHSLNFARKIDWEIKNKVRRKTRGVKQAGFYVLARTAMPSVLVELGFLSNPGEERFLNDALGQIYMASAIFRAFRAYKKELEVK